MKKTAYLCGYAVTWYFLTYGGDKTIGELQTDNFIGIVLFLNYKNK